MAQEYKHAMLYCIVTTVIAALGIILGLLFKKPLVIALSMLPAIIYEIYRTEGTHTRLASWLSLAVLIAEAYVIITGITVDITKYISGFLTEFPDIGNIHLGLIGPVILVILAIYLFKNTAGIYTRWLSVVILITSVAVFYSMSPEKLSKLIQSDKVQESIKRGIENRIR